MKENVKQEIEDFMDELVADYYDKGYNWNGYEVYEPKYFKMTYIGYPLVVLVKGSEVRLSTNKESIDYLNFSENEKIKKRK